MATLSDLRTKLALELRDPTNATFSTGELDDAINLGIEDLGRVRPREVVTTAGTVAAGVFTYALTDFTNVYRVDLYTSAGEFRATIPHGIGDGPNSGWETHAGVLYLPPSWPLQAGDTLRAFGYAAYTQLSADSSTTDLDTTGIAAVMMFCKAELYDRLTVDRAKFQQWQEAASATDVGALQMAGIADRARSDWMRRRAWLHKPRKLG